MIFLVFVIIMIIYALICFYIAFNGWVWLTKVFSFKYKKVYITLITFLSLNIFLERMVDSTVLAYVSGIWMIILLYGLIIFPFVNVFTFLTKGKRIRGTGFTIIALYVFIFVYGSYNAWQPRVISYEVNIDKEAMPSNMTLMLVSDLHLGKVVGKNHLEKLVAMTNERKPDMIVIAGDIIDDYIEPFLHNHMGESMAKLSAPLGVFATSGNHDYYGNDLEALYGEMKKTNVQMLADETLLLFDSIYLVGRNDATDRNRNTIQALLQDLDKDKPIIMIDHQPTELDEALQHGVDILLSGHTHRGQLAPINFITNIIYENDWGYLQKGSLHSFVSSGFGLWGPPFRIGSQSEVMEIKIHFRPLQDHS